ncbi:hypothetical protein, partial [Neisseria elongata]|uniref:hypothetical protein n=1 Tax=Neisseria elongata TaxID=495 RepID=UPI001F40A873
SSPIIPLLPIYLIIPIYLSHWVSGKRNFAKVSAFFSQKSYHINNKMLYNNSLSKYDEKLK